MNSPSFARSEVWKVRLIIGSLIHRLPSFRLTPKISVYNKRGIEARKIKTATLE
jgi:hypothetical protein